MPVFEPHDSDWKFIKAKRDKITKQLIAKGLVLGSLKFDSVLYRKMRRR